MFVFIVFLGEEIPNVAILPHADVHSLEHNEEITIICNLTERGNNPATTSLTRISWLKNGVIFESVRNPDPSAPLNTLGPLVIKNADVKDGGNYTCLLEVLLRNVREISVSDHTMIHSKYTYFIDFQRFDSFI